MKKIILILLIGLTATPIKSQSIAADIDSIVNSIFNNYPEIPGMVIGVHQPDYGQFVTSIGVEKLGDSIALDTSAIFSIGSVNKNFMWVLMHRLHQEGRLDIFSQIYYDDPTGEQVYINQLQDSIFKYQGSRFSIAELMKHTTGMVDIPNSNNYPFFISNDLDKEYSLKEVLSQLFNSNTATNECSSVVSGMCRNFSFGLDHQYSSYGPMVASVIAEIETGKNARQLAREYVFDTLEMHSTSFLAYDDPVGKLTYGHDCIKDSNGICTSDYEVLEWYDENGHLNWQPYTVASFFRYPIYSNVTDLLLYVQAQFNDTSFIKASTLNLMKNDYVLWYNVFKVGLGITNYEFLWSTNEPMDDFFGHAGDGTFGHGTTIAHRCADHLSIVILTNVRSSGSPYENFPHFDLTKAIGEYFNSLY